ncbi:hypothetical protein BD413DRAFT_39852 [Trametes elegans]|nr:hypothetical protein BD413DRAFT_39852 [Trametes elegans]
MAEILRLVWKLTSLECVYLNPAFKEKKPLSDTELKRLSTNAGARNCALKSVELERNVAWAINFPPGHVFGDNLVELTVHWADSFLARQFVGLPDHVSCLPRLRRLILVVAPVDYTSAAGDNTQGFSQWIASVIPCARGHTALRSIVLRFWRQQGDWFSRTISRYVFLQELVTQTFGSAAANLEDRHDLVFELPLGPPDLDGVAETSLWWEEQLRSRLPELHARLVVTLHALTGALSPRTSKVWIPMRQDGPAQLEKAGSDWSYASDVDSIYDYQDSSSPPVSEHSELEQSDPATGSPMYDSDSLTGITPQLDLNYALD